MVDIWYQCLPAVLPGDAIDAAKLSYDVEFLLLVVIIANVVIIDLAIHFSPWGFSPEP